MKDMDIQFYGERGIINGILLDIYRDKNKDKKLNSFFDAIKLFDGKDVPWKDDITNCKWMVEPSFAHFGDPDLIAVFESGEKKYAIFIEAKLKDYVSSCFSLEREDGIVNLKGQSSKLNVQLSFRYRFVQAFKEAQKKSSQAIIEPCHKHPDGRRRKLQKESVVESVTKFLEGVDEYYFIALTNDSSSETVIEEMSSNFHPPLNDFDKQYFGILTYKDLINEGIVGEKLGFFDKACKMMGVKILQLSDDTSCKNNKDKLCNEQNNSSSEIKNIKSIHINNWEDHLRKIANEFVNNQNLQFGFIKLSGSYSLKLGGEVVMKLMQCQYGADNKLMLGLLDTSSFNAKNWKGEKHQAYNVGVGNQRKTFYFYTVEEHNIDEMINLVNKYCESFLKTSEPIDVWQAIPKNGICGNLLGLQYNTGLWTSQATADSAEDLQETDNITPPNDELHLLIETEKEKAVIEVVMENISALSLNTLSSSQKEKSSFVKIQRSENENDKYELYVSQESNNLENHQNSLEYKIIASSQWVKWRNFE